MDIDDTVARLGHLIDGTIVRNDRRFPVDSPSTGEMVAECPEATSELLDDAMAAAKGAQPGWMALGEVGRQAVIQAMSDALAQHIDDVLAISALEKGAVGAALEAYAASAFMTHRAATPLPVDILEDTPDRSVKVVRKPIGVVAAIAPWNAPILIMCEKIATALLVGNTVVAKPSPFTPLATLALGDLWKDIVPPGVVNILAGGNDLGAAMVAHPTAKMISFTGSVAAGRHIAAEAGGSLKKVVLELGGNDAAIVLPDVDVETVAAQIFGSAFLMGGQVCAAIKRLYVHQSIYDDMVGALSRLAEAAVPAPEAEGGTLIPLTTRPQYDRVRLLLADALAEGAHADAGGGPTGTAGYFIPATILTDVKPGMKIVDEEQFGPVLPVLPFTEVDDAIAAANATDFGLCGSVWTADIPTGEALAARLECGTSWVNSHAEIAPHIPFGGTKNSGVGRSGGTPGIDGYAELQTQYVYKASERVTGG
ncbi:MAG TPA: aldehyde dehydrogenase family protein [Acidimicrobiales bacterium]|nr:aldehyde dehydrogenase family protein [Acidimicrobiales bacterium]